MLLPLADGVKVTVLSAVFIASRVPVKVIAALPLAPDAMVVDPTV